MNIFLFFVYYFDSYIPLPLRYLCATFTLPLRYLTLSVVTTKWVLKNTKKYIIRNTFRMLFELLYGIFPPILRALSLEYLYHEYAVPE